MIGRRAFTALMVGWLLTSAVQTEPRPGDIAGVYPSAGPGDRTLYAIARVNPGAGPATTRSGESIIQVFRHRQEPPRRRDRQSLLCSAAGCVHARAARRAPLGTGSQSLHPNYGREYALQRIMVGVREGRLRLEETVLVSTGFLPRIMHGRIKLRLGSALNPGDLADEMTAKALEDTTRADKNQS